MSRPAEAAGSSPGRPRRGFWSRDALSRALCVAAVWAMALWSNPSLRAVTGVDTQDYLDVARDLSSNAARDRPPAYPLFLRAAIAIGQERWPAFVVGAQMLLLGAIASILFGVLRAIPVPLPIAALSAIFCSVTPGLLRYSSSLLPELLLGFLITLSWSEAVRLARADSGALCRTVWLAVGCGAVSGLAVLVKPVWILGIVPLAAGVFLMRRRAGSGRAAAVAIVMVFAAVLVIVPWQLFLLRRFGQTTISRVGAANVNLTALRAGLVEDGRGTPLYGYLASNGLLDDARRLRWEDFDEFTRIKVALPWEIRVDPGFQRRVLERDFAAYAWRQARRLPAFFSTHPPPLADGEFPGLPGFVRRLYVRVFDNLFRANLGPVRVPVLLILLIAGLAYGMTRSRLRPVLVTGALAVAYYAAIVAFLTYQDSHFIRMRIPLEPVLLTLFLVPFLDVLSRVGAARVSVVSGGLRSLAGGRPSGRASSPRAASG